MSQLNEETEVLVGGLKNEISRANGACRAEKEHSKQIYKFTVKYISETMEDCEPEYVHKKVFELADLCKIQVAIESATLGIYTTIGDYTNRNGRVHKAHFTQSGIYAGPAKKNDGPKSYTTYEYVSQEKHTFNMLLLETRAILVFERKPDVPAPAPKPVRKFTSKKKPE
jgi:hypothetical protein